MTPPAPSQRDTTGRLPVDDRLYDRLLSFTLCPRTVSESEPNAPNIPTAPTGSIPTGSIPAGCVPAGCIPPGLGACRERADRNRRRGQEVTGRARRGRRLGLHPEPLCRGHRPEQRRLGRWTDGVAVCAPTALTFAAYWTAHNARCCAPGPPRRRTGSPSTRCGSCSATRRRRALVRLARPAATWGRPCSELRRQTGLHWRVVNLSVSGSLMRDVITDQLPRLGEHKPDLVTCGAGDERHLVLRSRHAVQRPARAPRRRARQDRAARPAAAVRVLGDRRSHERALHHPHQPGHRRGRGRSGACRSAEVSAHFTPPWAGKFSVDNFHPSQDGYRDWSRALVEALTPALAAA